MYGCPAPSALGEHFRSPVSAELSPCSIVIGREKGGPGRFLPSAPELRRPSPHAGGSKPSCLRRWRSSAARRGLHLTRRASLHSPEHPLSSRGDFTAQHLRQASDLIARQPDAGLLRAARTEKPDTLRSGLASRPRDRFSERPHILRHRPVCDPYRYGVCRREELLYWNRRGAHGHDGSSASLPEY